MIGKRKRPLDPNQLATWTVAQNFNVSFGEVEAIDLTKIGLSHYLRDRPLSSACAIALRNPNNRVIFSAARAATKTYTFKGSRGGTLWLLGVR